MGLQIVKYRDERLGEFCYEFALTGNYLDHFVC